jgi:TPR repeat protein
MGTTFDTQLMHLASPSWRVRFVTGQAGPSGRRPKSVCGAGRSGKLFTESLDHGDDDAGVDLGYIYDKGCAPIAEDDQHAFQIYLLCAKLGVLLCQNNVGAMLRHGRGVTAADPARGYGWIKLAALHGDELAKANLGDPLFTAKVRAAGLLNLADIQRRLLTVPADPRAIKRDPWY